MKRWRLFLFGCVGLVLMFATADVPAATSRSRPPATLPSSMTALPSGAKVAIIKIDGLIYDFTQESFQRRAEAALRNGVSVIVIEFDTPGGFLASAIKLSRYIKTLPVPTVAWINNEAYSAGILLAASCNWIVMAPAAATGDCAPIVPGQNLAPTERAKALSPLLEEFRDSAQLNGYDFALFHAMCELGVDLYLIENPTTGQRRVVETAEYQMLVHSQAPPTTQGSPGVVPGALPADAGQWQLVTQGRYGPISEPFHDGKTLLTLNQTRALEVGLAKALVGNEAELKQLLHAGQVDRYNQIWVEGAAYWLTRPWVKAILLLIVMIGFYLEFQAPGISVPGIAATVALILLLGAPFLIGLAQWWHVVLFLIGFVLLVIELFLTPTFGLLGVVGLLLMFVGLVFLGVPADSGGGLPTREMAEQLQWSAFWTLTGVIAGCVALFYITKHFGRLPLFKHLILAQPADSGPPAQRISGDEVLGEGHTQVGQEGVVVAELKPTGRAEIAGRIVDVTSPGEWIAVGRRVRVVEVRGNVIAVEEVILP